VRHPSLRESRIQPHALPRRCPYPHPAIRCRPLRLSRATTRSRSRRDTDIEPLQPLGCGAAASSCNVERLSPLLQAPRQQRPQGQRRANRRGGGPRQPPSQCNVAAERGLLGGRVQQEAHLAREGGGPARGCHPKPLRLLRAVASSPRGRPHPSLSQHSQRLQLRGGWPREGGNRARGPRVQWRWHRCCRLGQTLLQPQRRGCWSWSWSWSGLRCTAEREHQEGGLCFRHKEGRFL
jgi:hypothetical protein